MLTFGKAITLLKSPAHMVSSLKYTNNGIYDNILKLAQCGALSSVICRSLFLGLLGLSEVRIGSATSIVVVPCVLKIKRCLIFLQKLCILSALRILI